MKRCNMGLYGNAATAAQIKAGNKQIARSRAEETAEKSKTIQGRPAPNRP